MNTPPEATGSINSNIYIPEKDKALLDRAYSMKQMREDFEPLGYLARRAYEGKHFTYWNRELKTLSEIPQKKTMVTALPEVKNQTDKFQNFLAATDYTFTVIPQMLSEDDSVKESMMLSLLAKQYYSKIKDTTVLSDWIHYALVDPNVSFLETTPDDLGKDVTYRKWDFFDILFNPLISVWEDQHLIVKIIKKDIDDLKQSTLYHLPADYKGGGVGGEWQSWKDVYQTERYKSFADLTRNQTLIFEFYILELWTNEKGEKARRLRIKTLDGTSLVIRNDVYNAVTRMPIQPLRVYSGEWWQPSYTYGLIALNRSLDTMINRFDDLFLRLTKGGWIIQSEEDVQGAMNEEMGQIIKYDAVKPEPITMQQVPNFFVELFSTVLNLSERYGLNSIFSGNMPNKSSGLRSNKMIDSIKGLTQQNNTATLDNLKASLKGVLLTTFMYLYEMWDEPQDKVETDIPEKSPRFISAKFADGQVQDETTFLIPKDFKKFSVEIDDGLGYTLKARQEMAVQLYNMKDENNKPMLSSNALKKIFKMGASGYVMEADDVPMHQTKEFQQLIGSFSSMTPQQQQAVIQTVQLIGQQQGASKNPGEKGAAFVDKIGQGGTGGTPPPQPTPPPKPPGGGE